jgi:hypothetical protein
MLIPKYLLTPLFLAAFVGSASADAILFQDTFDRADSGAPLNDNSIKGPIDVSLDGITNNTGTVLTANNVYSLPFGLGGAGILNNELLLSSGPGTNNAFVNHNFTNASMLNGFSVRTTITRVNQRVSGYGGGFALGMTQAEAESADDAITGANKMQDGFIQGTFNTGPSIADFWVVLRADGSVAWGGVGNVAGQGSTSGLFGSAIVASKTGTISAVFSPFEDFNAGTVIGFEVFYNDDSVGSGTFAWSDTNANYIGLDARDNKFVTFDDFTVDIPEPSAFLLSAVGLLGLLRRRR